MKSRQLLLLELNEVNFEFLTAYIDQGHLPNFRRFFDRHGFVETTSESRYEELEPWIQWVTAHTGLPLASHGVFRLGDIVNHDIPQIWERLEDMGLKVGAISPMNAKCRMKSPAFFIPDPWTPTGVVASGVNRRMYKAIAQAVGDNAQSKISLASVFNLAIGGLLSARSANYGRYFALLRQARGKPWRRAMFLDLLLADVFSLSLKQTRPDFASLFVNAAAHIQHHYMFSSPLYRGALRNPSWYLADGEDPLLEVYELYDHILGQISEALPDARIVLATGLHQDPHPDLTYYWRLKAHASFLKRIGVEFSSVEPLMSRDFILRCDGPDAARAAATRLSQATDENDVPLFEIDNRGSDLFVMLTYPRDIGDGMSFRIGNEQFENLRADVAFVAIKNGRHNGIGYMADNGVIAGDRAQRQIALSELPDYIVSALAA